MRDGRGRSWRTASVIAAVVGVLCGCSVTIDGQGSTPHVFAPPTAPDDVVVEVFSGGGNTSEAAHLRTTASHTLMGDGTLIVESGKSDYDDALVTLEKGTLSEAEINDVVANADTAGLIGPERDYDQPNVTDMSTTWVTIAVDDTTYGQSAYALYFTENDDDLSPAVQKRRVQLRDFIEDLDEIADDTVDYVPDAIVVYRMSVDQDPEPENAKAWPIATAPPEPTGSGTCIVVEGDEAYALAEAVEDAHAGDLWQVGTDAPTQFAMRPMLPGDEGCKR